MNAQLRILHLEDDENDSNLMKKYLNGKGIGCDLFRVDTRVEFMRMLDRGGFDLIISDYTLPSFNGSLALALAKERYPEIPYIFVSGTLGEEAAIESMASGATDYVLKPNLNRLVPAIRRAMLEAEERKKRKNAEAETLRQKTYFQQLFENAPIGIVMLDSSDTVLDVNKGFERIFQYTTEEIKGKSLRDTIVPSFYAQESRDFALESLERGITSKETVRKRKDGALIHVNLHTVPLIIDEHPVGIYAIYEDITNRKQAEEALRESQRLTQRIFDTTPNLLYLYDLIEQRNVYANREMAIVLGYTPGEIKAMGTGMLPILVHPDDLARVIQHHKRFSTAQNEDILEIEYRIRHANGEWRWLYSRETVFSRVTNGQPKQILGTAQDITERKRAGDEVRELARHIKLLLNSVDEGIFGLDLTGRCTFINPAAAKLFGWDLDEFIGQTTHMLIHHTRSDGSSYPAEECPIEAAFRHGVAHQVDSEIFWRKDKTSFPVDYSCTPIRDEQGHVTGAVVVFRDITEKKKLEQQFLRAQRMESIGALASGIAHDLNNILAPIIMAIDILQRR
ncbi:MAG: PAS domain S-box protein [Ignavibacteria bacterium]|nr:PAS domain S-box protein [Ignavibacteria bacterium]MBI3765419.1 PAS domain S-box protein [Ignavibacteriales bacterium]